MAKRKDAEQLSLNLDHPSARAESKSQLSASQGNTVSLSSFKANRARSALIEQLEKSGLVDWKQAKIEV